MAAADTPLAIYGRCGSPDAVPPFGYSPDGSSLYPCPASYDKDTGHTIDGVPATRWVHSSTSSETSKACHLSWKGCAGPTQKWLNEAAAAAVGETIGRETDLLYANHH